MSKRWRSKTHLQAIREQCCVVCFQPAEAHHLIGYGTSGMGLKSPDSLAFPLCHTHHIELHDNGIHSWEQKYGSQWSYVAKALAKVVEG